MRVMVVLTFDCCVGSSRPIRGQLQVVCEYGHAWPAVGKIDVLGRGGLEREAENE
jgi:hypothetical protein